MCTFFVGRTPSSSPARSTEETLEHFDFNAPSFELDLRSIIYEDVLLYENEIEL